MLLSGQDSNPLEPSDSEVTLAPLLDALQPHSKAIAAAARVWVGLSGGADSTALLIALARSNLAQEIHASHINYGVQAESDRWADHCRALCERLQVPLNIIKLDTPGKRDLKNGFEAWAREIRYRHWRALLGADDLLLLGHHRADQQETVALRLLQGRLPLPIPVSRELSNAGARLLRPWLALSPQLLRAALRAAGESWVEDPSNRSPAMLRNHVRAWLLPRLAEDPGRRADGSQNAWPEQLQRCGDLTQRLVNALRSNTLSDVGSGVGSVNGAGVAARLPLVALRCPAALQAILKALGASVTHAEVADAVKRLLHQQDRPRMRADSPESGSGIAVGESQPAVQASVSLWLSAADKQLVIWRKPLVPPQPLELPQSGQLDLRLEHGLVRIDGAPGLRINLRAAQPGDRVEIGSKTRPVREVLRSNGVPRWARSSYPVLLLDGSSEERRQLYVAVVPTFVTALPDEKPGLLPLRVSARVPARVPLRAWFSEI